MRRPRWSTRRSSGFALAYQSVAFAYYGWEDAAKMAEEIRDPGRSLPRILIGGAVAVAVLYLMVNTAYLAALTPQEMAGSELVARDAVQGVFGNTAATFVVVASLLILISSGNVNFLGMPRVAFGLARSGLAPKIFQYMSPRGTPVAGLFLIGDGDPRPGLDRGARVPHPVHDAGGDLGGPDGAVGVLQAAQDAARAGAAVAGAGWGVDGGRRRSCCTC